MQFSILLAVHLLSAVIWVGGMFFAYVVLRPAAGSVLDTRQRLTLWSRVFRRFFPWVWLAIGLLLASGYLIIFGVYGGMKGAGIHIHIMHGLGWLMIILFIYMNRSPVLSLHRSVITEEWSDADASLATIRRVVGINLALGLITVTVAAIGKFSV